MPRSSVSEFNKSYKSAVSYPDFGFKDALSYELRNEMECTNDYEKNPYNSFSIWQMLCNYV